MFCQLQMWRSGVKHPPIVLGSQAIFKWNKSFKMSSQNLESTVCHVCLTLRLLRSPLLFNLTWTSYDPSIPQSECTILSRTWIVPEREGEYLLKVNTFRWQGVFDQLCRNCVLLMLRWRWRKYPWIHILLGFPRSSERIIGHVYTITFSKLLCHLK